MTKTIIVFVKKECGPSQQARALLKKHPDLKGLQIINVDSFPRMAREYNLKALPTTIFVEDMSVDFSSQVYKKVVGFSPELITKIKEFMQ